MINPHVFTAGCPTEAAGSKTDPATRIGCTPADFGEWFTHLPARLAHLAAVWWPWLLAGALLVVVLLLAARAGHRRLWRRAVARGYWVRLTPPRTVNPGQAGQVWRLLAGLARLARAGRHLTHPPLALEMYGIGGGRLVAGLWLPRWVPLSEVLTVAGRAWPGVRAEPATPPSVTTAHGTRVAGYWLAANGGDVVALTDPPRPVGRGRYGPGGDDDPLASVLDGLHSPDGPAVLQVLVRPVTGERLAKLGHAARFGVTPRKPVNRRLLDGVFAVVFGAVRLLLDLITDLISSGATTHRTGHSGHGDQPRRPSDPLAIRAMRDAGDKLADGPHLLATVRIGAARPDAGYAVMAARSAAEAFITASRVLRPVRLRRAAVHLPDRWAARGAWLLCSAAELGVLAHLPADPARHGFDTAALTRTPPTRARRARPEHGSSRGPGWTRRGWTDPPDDRDPDDWQEGG